MTDQTNQPAAKLRSGGIEATIWANPKSEGKGFRYSVTYSRSYKVDDQWRTASNFSEIDNLKLARLALKVQDRIDELKASDKLS
ncbi:hypothetical protein [Rhodopirellula bahusiensis]|uniref:Uncharacterized protein n=1 Tax=Rhodopirellula bahusiensis TaxID=2014065 RepID=A0A2G1VXK5_9BACT|nr:hypothetical protein [Rhodopirellula bahusiensis]PHQ31507.1 hypothetical protein CEE69_30835 [Rhodopirellula bahusiensis]